MSIHAGHRSRVKTEFLARGLEGWPDHRVLELLLFYAIPQGDVNALAHELLNRFETLAGVFDASVDELKKVPGVGEHTAVLLRLIPALGGRYQDQRAALGQLVNSPEEAAAILSQYFYGARNEMVYILCLDGKRKLLGVRKVSEGSIHASDINIRRIAEEVKSGQLASGEISEALLASYLDTAGCPDPDLLIRPSGELRTSNFLLYQCAYSEFWFSDRMWPDFSKRDLLAAILDYQGRDRRFGRVKA